MYQVALFVSEHCDKSVSFPYECLPVLVLSVPDPFPFPVFHDLPLIFQVFIIPGFFVSTGYCFCCSWGSFLNCLSLSLLSWLLPY